jgi:hypothetical protein
VEAPDVRYAQSGDVNIAYSVVGDGPFGEGFGPSFAGDEPASRWWRRLLLTSSSLGRSTSSAG